VSYRAVRLAGSTRPANAVGRGGFHLSAGTVSRYVGVLAPILRRAEPTPFALEGAMRASIRSRLCLRGWRWPDADRAAVEVVLIALNRIGAARPTWKQGQPEYTQDGTIRIPLTCCANCGSLLPDEHWRYCSPQCGDAFRHRIYSFDRRAEAEAARSLSDGLGTR
jgi:hypothetical protein